MGEFLFQIVFEIGAYYVGKIFLKIFFPFIEIEELTRQKSAPKWKWKGFTYKKGNKRYFFTEAIQLVGLLIFFFIFILFVIVKITI